MAEYIEREALMRRIIEINCAECDSYHGARCRACWVDDTLDYIDSEPAADVAPVVHEKWLLDRWPSWPHRECSRCKIMIPRTKEVPDQYWQYCPNCGARMDGGNEGE